MVEEECLAVLTVGVRLHHPHLTTHKGPYLTIRRTSTSKGWEESRGVAVNSCQIKSLIRFLSGMTLATGNRSLFKKDGNTA